MARTARVIDLEKLYDYYLEVPGLTDPDNFSGAIGDFLKEHDAVSPLFPLPGSSVVGGRGLMHIRTREKVSVPQWNEFITTNSLSWSLLTERSSHRKRASRAYDRLKDPARLGLNKYFLDELGLPISGVIYMSTYAGTTPIEIEV